MQHKERMLIKFSIEKPKQLSLNDKGRNEINVNNRESTIQRIIQTLIKTVLFYDYVS